MKKYSFFSFLFILQFALNTQTVTKKVTLKELHKSLVPNKGVIALYNAPFITEFIFDDQQFYSITTKGSTTTFSKISIGNDKPEKPIKIKVPTYNGLKASSYRAFNIGENMYINYLAKDKSTKEHFQLVYGISKTGSISSKPYLIDKYTDVKGVNFNHFFEVIDDKFLVIEKKVTVYKGSYETKLYYMMYNEDFNKLLEKEIKPEIKGKQYLFWKKDYSKTKITW